MVGPSRAYGGTFDLLGITRQFCFSCRHNNSWRRLVDKLLGTMASAPVLAGRALSACNLLIFVGIFTVQWGIGLALDGFKSLGLTEIRLSNFPWEFFCCVQFPPMFIFWL